MSNSISKVKSFNLLLIFIITVVIIMIMTTSIYIINSYVKTELAIFSVIAFVGLLIVGFPVSIFLYITNNDKIAKLIFISIALTILGILLSGITWYILPSVIDIPWLVPLGMIIAVVDYLPLLFALTMLYYEQRKKLHNIINLTITYINVIFIIIALFLFLSKASFDFIGNFKALTYTFMIIFDVALISLSMLLFLINMPTKYRYLFSIIFGFYILSFIGDTMRLFEFLNIQNFGGNSQLFFDIMLLFLNITLVIYILSNIRVPTTVEEMYKKLEDTNLLVDDLILHSPDPMCMCNNDGFILKANKEFFNTFGIDNNYTNVNIFLFDFNFERDVTQELQKAKLGNTLHIDNVKYYKKDGSIIYLSIKIYPTLSTDKKLVNYVFLAEDITLRKNSEDALKNAYDQMENRVKERTAELLITNEALQKEIIEHKIDEEKIIASLKEKEVLLKEIHHRVKNNMQIISSMLGLQSSYVKDTQYNSLLKDSQNRIKSMALIHEKLYQSDNMANVNFFEYLKTLSINLYQSYGIDMERIKLEIDVEKLNLNIDTAIPLGLITNEIVSNSFKHGYPNGRSGKIYINIKNIQNNEYEMIIKDDGIGIPDGVNLNNVKTLGLSLIHALVEQIDGKIEIFSKNGLEYKIRFIS